MITITITSDKVSNNVGRIQQFVDTDHLNSWLSERNKDLIPGAAINGSSFEMNENGFEEDGTTPKINIIQVGTVVEN